MNFQNFKTLAIACGIFFLQSLKLLYAAPDNIFLDFSTSHDFQIIRDTGVTIRDFPGDKGYFIIKANSVRIKLPGGNEFSQRVSLLSANVADSGQINTLHFYGTGMPTDVAYQVAKSVHKAYGIPEERLEGWFTENKAKGWEGMAFSNGTHNNYPAVFLEVNAAINPLYPWKISTELSWRPTDAGNEGRNEKWGEENNPRPPDGNTAISLDPPDGKVYDPLDAYKDLVGKQEALDKKLGQIRGPDGRLLRIEKPEPENTKPALPATAPKNERVSPAITLALALGALICVGVVWYLLKKFKSR